MKKEKTQKQKMWRVVKAVFLLLLPLLTTMLTAFTMADSGKVSEFLTMNLLTPMFLLWFLSLLTDMVWNKYRCWKKKTEISAVRWIFYGVSLGVFFPFCFMQLFSKSLLLGGFHAS